MLSLVTIAAFWGIAQVALIYDQATLWEERPQELRFAGYCPVENDSALCAIASPEIHQKPSTYG